MQYVKLNDAERGELLAALAAMKDYLRRMFHSLSSEEARAPGPGGAFSPVEQVWHLADLEREGFGLRIRRLLEESNPRLPDFDGTRIAQERAYRSLSLAAGLEAFEAARDANLVLLRSVDAADWYRGGTQDGVGEVTLCDMPVFLRQHDQAHVAEIEQWIRASGQQDGND
jgi:hypothetical protein